VELGEFGWCLHRWLSGVPPPGGDSLSVYFSVIC
jgi:hypothetical protein